ncbi:MAG: hypothetical protein WD737_06035 [Gemmatimonadota bacterium]
MPFLLARPERISSFLDYLTALSATSVQGMDMRVFAELYVAVAIMNECSSHGTSWKEAMRRLCTGRSLHRRRYAARRAVGAVSGRMEALREREWGDHGPSCLLPTPRTDVLPVQMGEPLERLASRLLSVLAMFWEVSGEIVERELSRELDGTAVGSDPLVDLEAARVEGGESQDLELDGCRRRPKRRRLRVDQRRGRGVRQQRSVTPTRGRRMM